MDYLVGRSSKQPSLLPQNDLALDTLHHRHPLHGVCLVILALLLLTISAPTFAQRITITSSAGSNGSISPSGQTQVSLGAGISFTASPNTGYTVNNWTLDGTLVQTGGTGYTLNNVTAAHTVQVTFCLITYTVTPSAGANGSISPSTAQIVNKNANVSFTATPNSNYGVNTWSLDGTVVQTGGTTYTLNNVTTNHSVQVTFSVATSYTITPSAGANGSISPNSTQTENTGSNLTFTATPNTGYTVNTWSLDGTIVQTGGTTYVLTNIMANHSVQLTFTPLTYTVTPTTGANGAISPNSAQTANYGSNCTFSAIPNSGYIVNNWTVDGTTAQVGGTSFTLNDVIANHTVNVSFQPCFYITPVPVRMARSIRLACRPLLPAVISLLPHLRPRLMA